MKSKSTIFVKTNQNPHAERERRIKKYKCDVTSKLYVLVSPI